MFDLCFVKGNHKLYLQTGGATKSVLLKNRKQTKKKQQPNMFFRRHYYCKVKYKVYQRNTIMNFNTKEWKNLEGCSVIMAI